MALSHLTAVSRKHFVGIGKGALTVIAISCVGGIIMAFLRPASNASFFETMFGTAIFLGHQFLALSVGFFVFKVFSDHSVRVRTAFVAALLTGAITLVVGYVAIVKASGDRWSWGGDYGARGGHLEIKP